MSVGNGALPGLGFADAAFTEARFKSVLQDTSDYSILHIGTHFSLRPGNVMRSFLVSGVDGARALQQSQLELLALNIGGHRPYEQPFYWAGFVASQQ
jgi:CHAT domain-containing protein